MRNLILENNTNIYRVHLKKTHQIAASEVTCHIICIRFVVGHIYRKYTLTDIEWANFSPLSACRPSTDPGTVENKKSD